MYSSCLYVKIMSHINVLSLIVAGDANFNMASTNLTLAGFTQPAVARNLIENAARITLLTITTEIALVPL